MALVLFVGYLMPPPAHLKEEVHIVSTKIENKAESNLSDVDALRAGEVKPADVKKVQ